MNTTLENIDVAAVAAVVIVARAVSAVPLDSGGSALASNARHDSRGDVESFCQSLGTTTLSVATTNNMVDR